MSANKISQINKSLDPVHVVLAVYDPFGTYFQHAGVTITSVWKK